VNVPDPRFDLVDEIMAAWRVELPELAGVPFELSKRISRLARLIETATAAELDRLGLTNGEFEVLARLRSAGPPYRRKPNDLTKALLLSSGGTTHVLHRLTEAGLVTREADPDDRRSSWVRATPAGVEKAEAALLAANSAYRAIFGALPDETGRVLTDTLRDLARGPHIAYQR
jgi:DNA-binding MarR family transcriptional regulator